MQNYIAELVAIGLFIAASLTGYGIYRWLQEVQVGQINGWVGRYLVVRYGELPARLSINCSHDTYWPVLVRFDTPRTGVRHFAQFVCGGAQKTWFLLSETDESS